MFLCSLFSCIQLKRYKVGDKVVAIDIPGYDLFFQDGVLRENSILAVLDGKVEDKSNVSISVSAYWFTLQGQGQGDQETHPRCITTLLLVLKAFSNLPLCKMQSRKGYRP